MAELRALARYKYEILYSTSQNRNHYHRVYSSTHVLLLLDGIHFFVFIHLSL